MKQIMATLCSFDSSNIPKPFPPQGLAPAVSSLLCLTSFSSFRPQGGFHSLQGVSSNYLLRSLSVILHLSPLFTECLGQLAFILVLSLRTCLVLVVVFVC